MSDDWDGYAPAARAIGAVIWRAPMQHDRPEILPVRWWRDDADRYRPRGESAPVPHRFDPAGIPADARNPEWERMAYEAVFLEPMPFTRLDPLEAVDPIADIKIAMRIGPAITDADELAAKLGLRINIRAEDL